MFPKNPWVNHRIIYLLAYSLSTYILPIAEPAKIYKTQYVIQRCLQRLRRIPIRIIWIWHETRRIYNNLRFMKILLTHSKTYNPIFHIIREWNIFEGKPLRYSWDWRLIQTNMLSIFNTCKFKRATTLLIYF